MDGFVKTVKLVGAILAIATAAFIVYDRLFRDRPIFALHAKRPLGVATGRENDVYVRITNVTDEDIVIDEISIIPPHFTLVVDTEIRSMVSAMIAEFNPVIVGPLGERLLILMITSKPEAEHDRVTIKARWRGTRRPWPWKRHVRIKTTVNSVNALKTATTGESAA